jgi:hypothetical protein
MKHPDEPDTAQSVTGTTDSLSYPISEVRSAWLLGVMTGMAIGAAWFTHSWEPTWVLIVGVYGLFDNRRANAKLRASEKLKRQP